MAGATDGPAGAARGPAVDVSRLASELTDRELDEAIAEWMGWRRVQFVTGLVWEAPGAPEGMRRKGADVTLRPPVYASTQEGAADLRAHIRSLGRSKAADFMEELRCVLNDALRGDPDAFGASEFDMVDASPREQAKAAYMAFIHKRTGTE